MLIKRGSWAKSYRLGLGVGDGDELSHDGDESGFFAERSALGTLVILDTPSFAQGFRVGPGGLEIDDGRGYREEREDRRYRRMCRELRDRCENKDIYGEEGQGNCRRYRRMCG